MKSSRKLNLVWVMFSIIFRRQYAWQPAIRAKECSKGTRVSFYPWITSTGQVISLQFCQLLKASFRSRLAQWPYKSWATFFSEMKGLSKIAEWTENFSVTVRATAQPMDRPKRMICPAVNLLACRKETTLLASSSILAGVVSPLQRLQPRYSMARMEYCDSKLTIFKKSQAEVMSSPLAWKNSMILLRVPGIKRHGMYSDASTLSLTSKFPSRLLSLVTRLSLFAIDASILARLGCRLFCCASHSDSSSTSESTSVAYCAVQGT